MRFSFDKSEVGLFAVKIFKAILQSLYTPMIFSSNTENTVSSFSCVDFLSKVGSWHSLSLSLPLQNLGFCKAREPMFISDTEAF